MPKYTAWVPVWASAKYELKTDKKLNKKQLLDKFIDEAEPVGRNLCYECSGEFHISDASSPDFNFFRAEDIEEE